MPSQGGQAHDSGDPVAGVVRGASSAQSALAWLVTLRWHAAAAQALVVGVATRGMKLPLPAGALLALAVVVALSNLALDALARSARRTPPAVVGGVLLADTALLTIALALSGGPSNPFAALYLVEVTLAALLLGRRWVVALVVASAIGYASLLAVPTRPLGIATTSAGALAVMTLTAAILGALAARVATALRARQADLARAEAAAARADKLGALTTLAAGAAHELATPLGTMAVAAADLPELIDESPAQARVEAQIIRQEIDRCRRILARLSAHAGETAGEARRPTSARELFALVRAELGDDGARLRTEGDPALAFEAPVAGLSAVLVNLVANGLQASDGASDVTLAVSLANGGGDSSGAANGRAIELAVRDRGAGIPADLLPRVGEPFFTTKPPGQGMGLGLFLATTFAAQCAGRLHVESTPGLGTTVRLTLPGGGDATATGAAP